MDNAVVQETFKRVDALAAKMGTTVAYLWPKLVAYQYGKALGFVCGYIAIILALAGGLVCSVRFWDRINRADCDVIAITSLGILVMLFIVGFFLLTLWAVPVLISPEAAAFYQLLER